MNPALDSRERQAAVVLASGFVLLIVLGLVMLLVRTPADDGRFRVIDALGPRPEVRVRLVRRDGAEVRVECGAGIRVTRPDGSRSEGAARRLVIRSENGTTLLDGRPCPSGAILSPRGAEPLRIDGRPYPGRLSLLPDPRRGHVLVLLVPLETYVACVLPREMPLGSPDAALRAQAIATRSYVTATILARRERAWDVVDTEASQVFGGLDRNVARGRRHVEATRGLVLVDGEEILRAYFSATCGGRTRSNAVAFGELERPALRGGSCGFCDDDADFTWTLDLPLAGLPRGGEVVDVEVLPAPMDGDGRLRLRFAGGDRREIDARRIRRLAAPTRLKSTRFVSAELVGAAIRLRGRGFGHRVGLCQNGARAMGRAGRDERQILAHYYPGAEIVRLRS